MTVVRAQGDGFLVQAQDRAGFNGAVVVGKADAITLGELGQLHRALGLGEQVQPLNHHAIQVQQY